MRSRLFVRWLLPTLMLAAAGCTARPGTADLPASKSAPPGPADPAKVGTGIPAQPVMTAPLQFTPPMPAPAAGKLPPPPGLAADVPTYPPEPRTGWLPAGLSAPAAHGGAADLERLALQIEQTGDPTPPEGTHAVLAGELEGKRYVCYLGGMPRPDKPATYILQKAPDGWRATPICEGARWIWPGTATMPEPRVVICGTSEGSGAVLTLQAYTGERQVLYLNGLQEGTVRVLPRPDGPPDLVVTGKLQWMDHKLDPWVTERFTYTWQDGRYRQASHERMADQNYHMARFVRLLEAGDLARAAAEMAAAPPEGLPGYLEQRAPDLERLAGSTWTTDGFTRAGRIYMHPARSRSDPWFWFEFGPDGRITALGEQAQPPTQ